MKALSLFLLAACAGTGPYRGVDMDALRTGGGFPVTAIGMWVSRSHVPRRYQHVIDWHGWAGPANVVFSDRYVCILPGPEWALVQIGDRPGQCKWQSPRGT